MGRLDLIFNSLADKEHPHRLRAFLASCAFHVLALCILLGVIFFDRSHLLLPQNGSKLGSPSITLEKITIAPPPRQPRPPQPPKPAMKPPAPAQTVAVAHLRPEPEIKPAPPKATVPVLAAQPSKPKPVTPATIQVAIQAAISYTATTMTQSSSKPAAPSSYAPGLDELPHPPYPTEARDRRQTGMVVMNVQFDGKGDVTHAEVEQSSGVPILDSETRSFIRMHWHSLAFAGQVVSVPVQYKLENL